jgi:class 3 adenylate cyclase/predicted ATPase
MQCPICKAVVREASRFCGKCGSALPRSCSACGHSNPADDSFCSACGASLQARETHAKAPPQASASSAHPAPAPFATSSAERRQLTVMFCDMVGSSSLSTSLDPEEQRDVVGAFQSCCANEIKRLDGMVAQYLGDGVLAYFGYPAAHEDDAERAVRGGLAILDVVGTLHLARGVKLQARIGVASGVLVVGDLVREGVTQENAAIGETTNLAARLQSLADPNTMVIAPETHRLVGALFEYRDLGTQTLKGFAVPVHVRQVLRGSKVESRFEAQHLSGTSPLLGREEELDLLLRRWEQAKRGEGRVVLLTGEPGIGKSRTARALRDHLSLEPHTPLSYFCSPYHQDSALYPFIGQLSRAAGFEPDESSEAKLDKLEALLAPSSNNISGDMPLLAALLSIPGGDRHPLPEMSSERRKERTLTALLDHMKRLSERQSVLMLFEDLHWIDPTSLELLSLAVDQIRDRRVLLVTTARPEFTPPWPSHRHVSIVALSRLDKAEGETLVAAVTKGKLLPPEVLHQILARTDGVPLFIEELTKMVLESGLLHEADNRYELAGPLPPLAIPSTLHASLLARLDRLASVKDVAQIGAVIGREFSYALLTAVAALPVVELNAALGQLVNAELIFQRGVPPDATYQFKHALVHDAAYDTLLKSRRQELHGKIARVVEEQFSATTKPGVLAYHYTQAANSDRASAYWLSAGRASLGQFALTEAERLLRLGLNQIDCLPPGAERDRRELDTQLCLGNVLIQAKGLAYPEADQAFKRAYALRTTLGRSRELIPILFGILVTRLIGGQPRAALEIAQEMLLNAAGDRQSEMIANTVLMDVHFWLGNFDVADQFLASSLQLYDEDKDIHLAKSYAFDMKMIALVYASHFQWMMGYPERALRSKRLADNWAKRLNIPFMCAFSKIWGSAIFLYCGQLDQHRLQVEEALAVSKQVGFPHFVMQAEIWGAWNRAMNGDLSDPNVALFDSALARMAALGTGATVPYFKALHAEVLAEQGKISEARTLLRDAIDRVDALGEESHAAEIHRIHASVLVSEGTASWPDAERAFLASLATARRQGAKSWELRTATSYAHMLKSQGRMDEAHRLLCPIYGWFTEGFDTQDLKKAKLLLEELSTTKA